jgi:hypothetical protein
MKTFATTALALALTLFAAGCGSSDAKSLISDGHASLGSGDANAALEHFQEALGRLGHDDADYVEAKLGEIEALIALDTTKAKDEFLVLANALPNQVGQAQYLRVGGQMANGKRFTEAVELTDAGIKRFGAEAPQLKDLMARIEKEALAAGAKGATDARGYFDGVTDDDGHF